jgi:putative ABC transport system permease protein
MRGLRDSHPLRQAARFRLQRRFRFGADPRREVDDELHAHLRHCVDELTAQGVSADDAEKEATARFGNVGRYAGECADIDRHQLIIKRREELLGNLWRDLLFAARLLRRSPGYAASAILTLALGIGANTAVFSVFYGVLLRPLAFPHPDQLALLYETNPLRHWTQAEVAPANFLDWRQPHSPFSDLTAYSESPDDLTLTGYGTPRIVSLCRVYGNFFPVLGISPARGRTFTEAETWSQAHLVVLSDSAWHRLFGSDPNIVGSTIHLNGRSAQVIGVMPPRFSFPFAGVDAWLNLNFNTADRADVGFRRAHWLRVVGRLAPGFSVAAGSTYLHEQASRLEKLYPATNIQMGAGLTPLRDYMVGDRRQPLLVLLLAVGLVLAAASVNVSLLQLVRSSRREREMVVRRAVGAAGHRLLRQLATESLLLSAIGGVIGIAMGWAGMRILLQLAGSDLPRADAVHLDAGVLLFALVLTALVGLLASLAPALALKGNRAVEALRAESGSGRLALREGWGRGLLVASEVALAALLVVGFGLLLKSFDRLRHVPTGSQAQNVLVATISLPSARYPSEAAISQFDEQILARARALPGVKEAALADAAPLLTDGWTGDFCVEGQQHEGALGIEFHHRLVSSHYFDTLEVPVIRGRALRDSDTFHSSSVVLINETLARLYFAGQDPIGHRIQYEDKPDPKRPWRTIVGIVGDEKRGGLASPPWPEIYASVIQEPEQTLRLLVRTQSPNPLHLLKPLQAAVWSIDRELPLYEVRTMSDVVRDSVARQRFLLILMTAFASITLALASVGIIGVVASSIAQKRREIGLRIALGATRSQVLHAVATRGLGLATGGLVTGLLIAAATSHLLHALLFEVSATDPATFVGVAVILFTLSVAATYGPALAALGIDPARVLRGD